jgi:hypothetical protein
MRIYFPNLSRPKRAAKAISAAVLNTPLALAQQAVARAAGYSDWHDLEQSHRDQLPSALDHDLSRLDRAFRLSAQRTALTETLGIYDDDALYLAQKARISGNGTIDFSIIREVADISYGKLPLEPCDLQSAGYYIQRRLPPGWGKLYGKRWRATTGRIGRRYAFPPALKAELSDLTQKIVPKGSHAIHAFLDINNAWFRGGYPGAGPGPYGILILAIAMPDPIESWCIYPTYRFLEEMVNPTLVDLGKIGWCPQPDDPIIPVAQTPLFSDLPAAIQFAAKETYPDA